MESRSQCFAAFGAREHWLNQLLPMHLPLASWNQEGIQWHSVVVSWNMLEWWEGTSTIFNLMHCPVSFVSLMYASANVCHFFLVVLNLLKWTLCPIVCKVQALAPEDVETGAVGGI